jgi:hypothetical protein
MNSEPPKFRLVFHQKAQSMLNAAIGDLLQAGWQQDEIDRLLRTVQNRLTENPESFGEPHYTLEVIHLTISVGFVRPLCIQIGIQEDQRIVFVRKVTLMTTDKT